MDRMHHGSTNKSFLLILGLLLAFYAGLGVLSVQAISITYDENVHYAYGEQMLQGNSQRTGIHGDSNMPFLAWNALPESLGSFLSGGVLKSFLLNFQTARSMTLIFSLLVAILVFHWSKSLYGIIPAFGSLLLYLFDPNIIAHSQLVTTDIYAAGTTTFVFYFLWRFAHKRNVVNGLILIAMLGVSQLAKYTTIVLVPLAFLVLFLFDLPSLIRSRLNAPTIRQFVLKYSGYFICTIIGIILIINMGFLFNRTFTNFGNYRFRSDWFQIAKSRFTALDSLPVPFPYPYLDGIDWMRHTQISGGNSGPVYLLGKLNKQGFLGYYFVASLLKIPIASQIMVFTAILLYFTRSNRRSNFLKHEIFLITPVIFYTIYFNFFFNVQIGIRYYLIIFPLVFIFTGSLFKEWSNFRIPLKISIVALFAYLVISVLSYYPYYLTYFNEFVWNRSQAYKFLADSNLDWGQSSIQLTQYMTDNPDAIYGSHNIEAGHLLIGVNDLVGVMDNPANYAWIRNNFEPTGTIANSILVYHITQKEIDKLDFTK